MGSVTLGNGVKTLAKGILLILLASLAFQVVGQDEKKSVKQNIDKFMIDKNCEKIFPEDLKHEVILFLKYDSMDVPVNRPKGYDKYEFAVKTNHNKMVINLNKELRKAASTYPFKYKIISMMDKDYASHGAKYLFWVNSFDAFTDGTWYARGQQTAIGIVDLTTNKRYVLHWNLEASITYKYDRMIWWLNKEIKNQFK